MSDKGIKDWKLEEIRERNIRIIDEVIDTFNSWDSGINDDKNNVLSSQEKAAIELIKSKGLEKYL